MEWIEDSKKRVVRIYVESSDKWYVIGKNLGIDHRILRDIGRDRDDKRDRVIKVLGQWYENASSLPHPELYPKTWRGLINLLNNSDLRELAKKVHKALLQQSPNPGKLAMCEIIITSRLTAS